MIKCAERTHYGIYALVLLASEISLVRFLIRQQLARKYCTNALSMKYLIHEYGKCTATHRKD